MHKSIKAGLIALVTLAVSSGAAFAAAPPTLTRGARGTDVATLQRLLTYNGEPVAITEVLGPTTEGLVKRFQTRKGLRATGVVDLTTWRRLQPVLRRGSAGAAVTALQHSLNEKHGYGLSTDGLFGPATQRAVIDFQRHMGLSADGIVGPNTWYALLGHYEELDWAGPGFYRYRVDASDSSWGTTHTVALIEHVARQWKAKGYGVRLGINDISKPHGGYFPPHSSHRNGGDVDIRPVRHDGAEAPVGWWDDAYSRSMTQALVDLLWATGDVELILFNDPHIRGVKPWSGHDHHLHVRFKR